MLPCSKPESHHTLTTQPSSLLLSSLELSDAQVCEPYIRARTLTTASSTIPSLCASPFRTRKPAHPHHSTLRHAHPEKGNSNSHGARPVHQIISLIKWRLTIKNSLSLYTGPARTASTAQRHLQPDHLPPSEKSFKGGKELGSRKVDVRLPGEVNSNSHGARPVHQIISLIKWIRVSRLSIKNSLSNWEPWIRWDECRPGRLWRCLQRETRNSPLGIREARWQ